MSKTIMQSLTRFVSDLTELTGKGPQEITLSADTFMRLTLELTQHVYVRHESDSPKENSEILLNLWASQIIVKKGK